MLLYYPATNPACMSNDPQFRAAEEMPGFTGDFRMMIPRNAEPDHGGIEPLQGSLQNTIRRVIVQHGAHKLIVVIAVCASDFRLYPGPFRISVQADVQTNVTGEGFCVGRFLIAPWIEFCHVKPMGHHMPMACQFLRKLGYHEDTVPEDTGFKACLHPLILSSLLLASPLSRPGLLEIDHLLITLGLASLPVLHHGAE